MTLGDVSAAGGATITVDGMDVLPDIRLGSVSATGVQNLTDAEMLAFLVAVM